MYGYGKISLEKFGKRFGGLDHNAVIQDIAGSDELTAEAAADRHLPCAAQSHTITIVSTTLEGKHLHLLKALRPSGRGSLV